MDPDDERHWYGIFYYDRDDPRVVVPKRYGWGRTLNYGRPMAWVWTFGAPAVVAVLTRLGRH
ncbi:DUF5808 domain-containing protein [Streptomyces sp. NPDC058451]|uniref:DUF5808 domain-containing protein n=1 Tax=Streptomyces sp. NPDC058451 TaxID=3346506 RepID=UPI00365E1AF2